MRLANWPTSDGVVKEYDKEWGEMSDNQSEYNGGACGALNQGKLPARQQEEGTTVSDN